MVYSYIWYLRLIVFLNLAASFRNIVFVQKNINELTLEFNKKSVRVQIDIASLLYLSKLWKKGNAITTGRRQRRPKQMTTIKQDFAWFISHYLPRFWVLCPKIHFDLFSPVEDAKVNDTKRKRTSAFK